MLNPFRKRYYVPSHDVFGRLSEIYSTQKSLGLCNGLERVDFWVWINNTYGVSRKFDWNKGINYLVFNSEQDYILFLLKL